MPKTPKLENLVYLKTDCNTIRVADMTGFTTASVESHEGNFSVQKYPRHSFTDISSGSQAG